MFIPGGCQARHSARKSALDFSANRRDCEGCSTATVGTRSSPGKTKSSPSSTAGPTSTTSPSRRRTATSPGGFINHNSYWHSTIMTQKALTPSEVIDYADHHSGTMAMSRTRLNPYKLGIELLRDIEMRWNTGRFGKEYDECDDLEKKRNLGQAARPGQAENLRGPPRSQRYHLHRHLPDARVLRPAQPVLLRLPGTGRTVLY